MDFAAFDFEYYQRTIETMYKRYYFKRIVLVAAAAVIIAVYTAIVQQTIFLNVLLLVALMGILIFLINQRGQFAEIYQNFLNANQPNAKIEKIEEDEYSYNVLTADGEKIRINKNGVRNLPSQNKQYSMMVGFEKAFFAKQPLQIVYYDMLEITYEEKFRLKRNGYSSVPRFLRRFTLGNLKASASNLFSFVLGNIFFLFIAFRILRYLISLIQSLLY